MHTHTWGIHHVHKCTDTHPWEHAPPHVHAQVHKHTHTPGSTHHAHRHTNTHTHTSAWKMSHKHTHTHTLGNTPHTQIHTCTDCGDIRLDERSQLTQSGSPAGCGRHPHPPHTSLWKSGQQIQEKCAFVLTSTQHSAARKRDPAIRPWGHEQARHDREAHPSQQYTHTHTHCTPPLRSVAARP